MFSFVCLILFQSNGYLGFWLINPSLHENLSFFCFDKINNEIDSESHETNIHPPYIYLTQNRITSTHLFSYEHAYNNITDRDDT